jgi:hypothetical protein
MFETILGVRWHALDQQDVRLGKPFQRGLQLRVLHACHCMQKCVGEVATDHRADLRDFTRRSEAVEPRHQRLLQCRWYCFGATLLALFQQEPCHFLNEQGDPASARGHAFDYFLRQGLPRCKLSDHVTNLIVIERREGD